MQEKATGQVTRVTGAVLDVRFAPGNTPALKNALKVSMPGRTLVAEVVQQLGVARCAASPWILPMVWPGIWQ